MAEKKTPIPTVAFDPAKHVIAGRETAEGRQLFFTLGTIVEAERQIEAPTAQPGAVTFDDLAKLEERVVKAARDAAPPAQFPADVMATLTDAAGAIVSLKSKNADLEKRVAELEAAVKVHTENFVALMKLAGG